MAEILEQHCDEIALLWEIRRSALFSPNFDSRQLRDLERRMELHLKALLYGRPLQLLQSKLDAEESAQVFAAAYSLLRGGDEGIQMVVDAFPAAQAGKLDGLREALCHGGSGKILQQLQLLLESPADAAKIVCLEVLAFHGRLGLELAGLEQFMAAEDPEMRQQAWRINSEAACIKNQQRFESAFSDKDARVRREALWSAAWTQQRWLPVACSGLASKSVPENWDAVLLLAILGNPEELNRILGIGKQAELGAKRFQILGAYGHPESVAELLRGMENPDLRSTVAAGAAFTKITGCDIESQRRVILPPEDGHEPDEFEKEFLDEAKLPDVEKAAQYWERNRNQFATGSRWAKGFNVSQGVSPEVLDQLDLQSRHEVCLRGRFQGKWAGSAIDLEKYPSKALPAVAS